MTPFAQRHGALQRTPCRSCAIVSERLGGRRRGDILTQQSTPRRPAIWLLVLINFSGTLAMHMFVPALPTMARDLNASSAAAQLALTLYVLGLAFGQLFY